MSEIEWQNPERPVRWRFGRLMQVTREVWNEGLSPVGICHRANGRSQSAGEGCEGTGEAGTGADGDFTPAPDFTETVFSVDGAVYPAKGRLN